MTTTATRPALTDPIRRARAARMRAADRAWVVEMIVAVNAALIIGMWLRHGGISAAGGRGGVATAAGQLTGLLGTYSVLLQLLLMARLPWLERYVGLDRLAIWHRWNGVLAVNLLVAHTALITIGYAASNHATLWAQTRDFISNYADVLMAFGALVILIAVGVTSARAARRRLRRETWYFVHLYAYLAVALGFAHQLAVGNDFVTDPIARAWWVALYLVVITILVTCRVIRPWRFNARHQITVESVVREAPGVVTIKLTGRHLGAIRAPRPVFPVAVSHTRWMVEGQPLLAFRGTDEEEPAHHRQGSRRHDARSADDPQWHTRICRGAVRNIHCAPPNRTPDAVHRGWHRDHADTRHAR